MKQRELELTEQAIRCIAEGSVELGRYKKDQINSSKRFRQAIYIDYKDVTDAMRRLNIDTTQIDILAMYLIEMAPNDVLIER